jgi:L-serine dehydratase
MKAGIFNDVIGPVMRGPSSSHTAASHRIGTLVRQLCNVEGSSVVVEFDNKGSLATTYEGQGSAMGLISGLAGRSILDPEITAFMDLPAKHNFKIEFRISDYHAPHPNTYKITVVSHHNEKYEIVAISTGGGMIELISFNGYRVSMRGDCHETIACFRSASTERMERIFEKASLSSAAGKEVMIGSEDPCLITIKSRYSGKDIAHSLLEKEPDLLWISHTSPVLPVMPVRGKPMPFESIEGMLRLAGSEKLDLARMAIIYESAYSGMDPSEVKSMMNDIVNHVSHSIKEGLKNKHYHDRLLGHQSHLIPEAEKSGKLISSPFNTIIAYVTAIMESKSSMEVIVAAPTAGSCGAVGGSLFGAEEYLKSGSDQIVNAYLAAGLTGVFIADKYTFAAEEGGCQVECGAASAMAASGLVQLMGGNAEQAVNAASMALQNCLGMICDPVADRVEMPCLGKNILAASNALNCANMSIAGYNHMIPLSEVIEAMKSVGAELPRTLCCTGLGGLSQTPTSLRLHKLLKKQ